VHPSNPINSNLVDDLIEKFSAVWATPQLAERVQISFSARFRSSLGNCRPTQGDIRLSSVLLDSPQEVFEEVLCHELAHMVAFELYGPAAKPHGREWKALMQQAGYAPRVRMPRSLVPHLPKKMPKRRPRWVHRFPIFQKSRIGRRPVLK
jgi:SprT protein